MPGENRVRHGDHLRARLGGLEDLGVGAHGEHSAGHLVRPVGPDSKVDPAHRIVGRDGLGVTHSREPELVREEGDGRRGDAQRHGDARRITLVRVDRRGPVSGEVEVRRPIERLR